MKLFRRINGWLRRLYSHRYNRQHPISAIFRLAQWQHLRWRGIRRDYHFWGTRTIRCYPDADNSMWLLLNHVMDWDEFHFIRRYLRPSDTMFDIGANIGIYSLWASQYLDASKGGRVFAFEPDPGNQSRLREQIGLNDLAVVEVVPAALSDRQGTIRFAYGKDNLNHIITEATEATASIEVSSTTLDAFSSDRSIDRINFAKIDVEGAEQLVLEGAARGLAGHRIDVLQLEFNRQAAVLGLNGNAVEDCLSRYGYVLYRYDADKGRLAQVSEADRRPHENLFAIADLAMVHERLSGSDAARRDLRDR